MDELLLIASVVGLGAGMAILLVGSMFGLVVALDNTDGWKVVYGVIPCLWVFSGSGVGWSAGIGPIVVSLASMVYCFMHRESRGKYPLQVFLYGLLMTAVAGFGVFIYWVLYR